MARAYVYRGSQRVKKLKSIDEAFFLNYLVGIIGFGLEFGLELELELELELGIGLVWEMEIG